MFISRKLNWWAILRASKNRLILACQKCCKYFSKINEDKFEIKIFFLTLKIEKKNPVKILRHEILDSNSPTIVNC